jgi:hypothetical protein
MSSRVRVASLVGLAGLATLAAAVVSGLLAAPDSPLHGGTRQEVPAPATTPAPEPAGVPRDDPEPRGHPLPAEKSRLGELTAGAPRAGGADGRRDAAGWTSPPVGAAASRSSAGTAGPAGPAGPVFSVPVALSAGLGAAAAAALAGLAGAASRAGRRSSSPAPATASASPSAPVPPAPRFDAARRTGSDPLVLAAIEVRDVVPSPALAGRLGEGLAARGIDELDPAGQRFDPATQTAIATAPTEDPGQEGVVAHTDRLGYLAHGQILRHAQVTVFRRRSRSS